MSNPRVNTLKGLLAYFADKEIPGTYTEYASLEDAPYTAAAVKRVLGPWERVKSLLNSSIEETEDEPVDVPTVEAIPAVLVTPKDATPAKVMTLATETKNEK